MLELDDKKSVAIPAWTAIPLRAALPEKLGDYFGRSGVMPSLPDSRRGYHRKYMRAKAVAQYQDKFLAVYLADISRSGLGFYSPIQIFPCEVMNMWLGREGHIQLVAKTCVRIGHACYRCGAQFKVD